MPDFDLLAKLNPWWKDPQSISADQKVREALSKTPPYSLPPFPTSGWHSLRGPRQVGQTTFPHLAIRHLLLEHHVDPKTVFFFSCDGLSSKQDIIDTVLLYANWTKTFGIRTHHIFLDEVTFINRWEEAVKFLIDNDLVRGTVVFTGSLASDLKRGTERFPGRGVSTHFYSPLSFREYALTFGGSELKQRLVKTTSPLDISRLKNTAPALSPFISELTGLLEAYLITGRFFRSSYEYFETGSISEGTYETYLNWILGDISKVGKREHIFKQVMAAVCRKYGSSLSLNAISKETDIGSHVTVGDYLDAANDLLLLNVLPKVDLSRGVPLYRKEKKYYFSDPFLFSALSGYVRGRFASYVTEENKSALLEGVVLDHLRHILNKSYITAEQVWFYNDRRGEIDFIATDRHIPIEVKWQNTVTEKDFQYPDRFRSALILSKRTLVTEGPVVIVPLPLFLALLQDERKEAHRKIKS